MDERTNEIEREIRDGRHQPSQRNPMDPVSSVRPYVPPSHAVNTIESNSSGVSWGAVMAGAFGAAALSLALLALGAGIGFSSVSPWSNSGASASAIGWAAIGWMVLMQLLASSLGGYLAGRLRTKWVGVHTHEVYFRDTAHGFLVWAVGMVVTAAFLTSAVVTLVGGAAGAAGATAAASPQSAAPGTTHQYLIDTMLRAKPPATKTDTPVATGEIALIIANSLRRGSMLPADRVYLAQLVAARTGVTQSEAEKRVDDADREAREAADTARKAAAHSLYWTFLALLVGAFSASLAATIGGKERDRVPALNS